MVLLLRSFEKQRLARSIQAKVDVLKMNNADTADKREFELAVFMRDAIRAMQLREL